jgi:hypothetical protein
MRRLMLAVLAGVVGCDEATESDSLLTAPPITVSPSAEVQLKVGQSIRLTGPDLVLQFVAVPEDSRCPINAVCVWVGDARIALLASGAVERSFNLHFPTEQVGARKISLSAYEIEAVALEPAPIDGEPRRPDDYRVTLKVLRITSD